MLNNFVCLMTIPNYSYIEFGLYENSSSWKTYIRLFSHMVTFSNVQFDPLLREKRIDRVKSLPTMHDDVRQVISTSHRPLVRIYHQMVITRKENITKLIGNTHIISRTSSRVHK